MRPDARIFDISAPLSEGLVTWPGTGEGFRREVVASLERGDPMRLSAIEMGAHCGTHVDAPCHFVEGAGGVDSIPVSALVGAAEVVEVPADVDTVSADILEALVPGPAARILLKTRNSGWSTSGDDFREDYVACDESAAAWMLRRGTALVGIDYLSIEPFDADERDFPVHRALLAAGVAIVESIDLSGVPAGRYRLAVLPLLIPGSDGAPARAILRTET